MTLVTISDRKTVHIPARRPVFEILTPNLQGAYEFVWTKQEFGEGGKELSAHKAGLESALEAVLEVAVAESIYALKAGDCLTFDATLPHRYQNRGPENAVWICVAAPPNL